MVRQAPYESAIAGNRNHPAIRGQVSQICACDNRCDAVVRGHPQTLHFATIPRQPDRLPRLTSVEVLHRPLNKPTLDNQSLTGRYSGLDLIKATP